MALISVIRQQWIGLIGLVVGLTGVAFGATGQPAILGQANSAGKTTSVENTGAGPALTLKAGRGQPPLAVSSAVLVKNLNAERLGGKPVFAFAVAGASYSKAQSDGRYMPAGSAYTKVQSDTRYAAAGQSYSKAQSDDRYAAVGSSYSKALSDSRYAPAAGSTSYLSSLGAQVLDARVIAAASIPEGLAPPPADSSRGNISTSVVEVPGPGKVQVLVTGYCYGPQGNRITLTIADGGNSADSPEQESSSDSWVCSYAREFTVVAAGPRTITTSWWYTYPSGFPPQVGLTSVFVLITYRPG